MSPNRSNEETTVFAIYSSRHDAEVAQDYLRDRDIDTFVRADDAGGMHPQMQRPHGVKLVGMSSAAQDAYEALNKADLLPQTVEERPELQEGGRDDDAAPLTLSMEGAAGTLGVAAVVLIILYFLLA